jgi:hypothetical protein
MRHRGLSRAQWHLRMTTRPERLAGWPAASRPPAGVVGCSPVMAPASRAIAVSALIFILTSWVFKVCWERLCRWLLRLVLLCCVCRCR